MNAPIPVVSWDATDDEWRAARRQGCGASDVAALLGFSPYRSPWQVWAEKTGHPLAPINEESDAARLGHLLEPWLLDQASRLVYQNEEWWADMPEARLYRHAQHRWRLCSPDGILLAYNAEKDPQLVQGKTAGIQTGRAHGWTDDTIPLGYEFQARWEMHVMDAAVNHVIALVAGRGLCHYPIARDLGLEEQLVEQVEAWWQQHIVAGDEPALTGRDAGMVAALYPRPLRRSVALDDTDAMAYWQAYRDAHQDLTDAEQRKAEAGTALKALLGDAEVGLVDGRPVASWAARKGRVDYRLMAMFLANLAGLSDLPDEEPYRTPATRTFTIKE